jgi:hypothetical protein
MTSICPIKMDSMFSFSWNIMYFWKKKYDLTKAKLDIMTVHFWRNFLKFVIYKFHAVQNCDKVLNCFQNISLRIFDLYVISIKWLYKAKDVIFYPIIDILLFQLQLLDINSKNTPLKILVILNSTEKVTF